MTPRERASQLWGANYTPTMDAELTILERGGVRLDDVEWASEMVDSHSPRDEWGYFRHCCLKRAADRIATLRDAGVDA